MPSPSGPWTDPLPALGRLGFQGLPPWHVAVLNPSAPLVGPPRSVFAARARECDSRSVYETPPTLHKILDRDWKKASSKDAFWM
eukprot:1189614-Prorocentrum_minimum.AAC.1